MNGKRYLLTLCFLLLVLASCTSEDNGGNPVPTAAFTATPTTGVAPLEVSFDASRSRPEGALSYAWDFGEGTEGEGARVSHTYNAPGEYSAALTVTDAEGRTAGEKVTIMVNAATEPPANGTPTAAFTVTPEEGDAPLEVLFDATGSNDPDNDTLSYAWNFGDGETGEGATVRHIYEAAGAYTVMLTIEDGNGGSDSAQQTVRVNAPETPDFTALTWSTAAPQPFRNSEAQGLVLDGKLYSFGGFDETKTPSIYTPTDRAYVYDPATDAWTAIANMPPMQDGTVPGGTTHTGTATDGTDIYFAGGYTAKGEANGGATGQIFGTPRGVEVRRI